MVIRFPPSIVPKHVVLHPICILISWFSCHYPIWDGGKQSIRLIAGIPACEGFLWLDQWLFIMRGGLVRTFSLFILPLPLCLFPANCFSFYLFSPLSACFLLFLPVFSSFCLFPFFYASSSLARLFIPFFSPGLAPSQ